ncbi:hypothetical protein [Streptomyces sp. CA-106110]|uniref:hypothetical protein n=1 Tax=Streptomyces sp. CA-106110 TaxID=3240044 RepID=UPI003D89EF2D
MSEETSGEIVCEHPQVLPPEPLPVRAALGTRRPLNFGRQVIGARTRHRTLRQPDAQRGAQRSGNGSGRHRSGDVPGHQAQQLAHGKRKSPGQAQLEQARGRIHVACAHRTPAAASQPRRTQLGCPGCKRGASQPGQQRTSIDADKHLAGRTSPWTSPRRYTAAKAGSVYRKTTSAPGTDSARRRSSTRARLTPLTASPTSAPPTAPADLAYAAVSRDASTYWRSGTAPGSSTPGQPCSVHAKGGCAGPVDQQGGGYVAHGDEAAVVALAAGQHGTTTAPPP